MNTWKTPTPVPAPPLRPYVELDWLALTHNPKTGSGLNNGSVEIGVIGGHLMFVQANQLRDVARLLFHAHLVNEGVEPIESRPGGRDWFGRCEVAKDRTYLVSKSYTPGEMLLSEPAVGADSLAGVTRYSAKQADQLALALIEAGS